MTSVLLHVVGVLFDIAGGHHAIVRLILIIFTNERVAANTRASISPFLLKAPNNLELARITHLGWLHHLRASASLLSLFIVIELIVGHGRIKIRLRHIACWVLTAWLVTWHWVTFLIRVKHLLPRPTHSTIPWCWLAPPIILRIFPVIEHTKDQRCHLGSHREDSCHYTVDSIWVCDVGIVKAFVGRKLILAEPVDRSQEHRHRKQDRGSPQRAVDFFIKFNEVKLDRSYHENASREETNA